MVGVGGLEPPAPASQTRCAANCATPRTMVREEYNANRLYRQQTIGKKILACASTNLTYKCKKENLPYPLSY